MRASPLPEVVVVGAGIVGLSTAFQLASRGVRDVTIVERRHVGAGASGKSGAIIRTHYSNEPETRLALEGLRFFRSFGERVGVECRFDETGFLVFADPDDRDSLEANLGIQAALGIPARIIDPDELREIDPAGMDVLQGNRVRVASSDQNVRRASRLVEIGWERWRRGEIDSAATLMPVYAHQPTSGEA